MPIYEYECTNCGQITEALQKFSDPPLTTCSHCQGRLKKLISQSTFHLKGTGWYVTDYKNKDSSSPRHRKKDAESSGTGKSEKKEGKSESKD